MNKKMLLFLVGNLLLIEAALLLFPALTALVYGESATLWIFLGVAGCAAVIGLLLRLRKPHDTRFSAAEGYFLVAFSWILMSLVGALPLFISGHYSNPVDALFEIISGFTTTGATVCTDVEVLPRAIQLWRSLSHWIGGMGVLVFLLAILPASGASTMHLMKAESPGPSVGKLVPKLRSTAALLYKVYLFLTLLEIGILMLCGAPFFDSVNLAMSTAGTGGFGIFNSSAAAYNNAVQVTLTVFMILFGVNFNVYFFLLTFHFMDAWHCEELRIYFIIITVAALTIFVNILPSYTAPGKALLDSFFQVGSIITTTGFVSADFDKWPQLSRTILMVLEFIGACAGSTGGGMKVSRITVMFRSIRKELSNITHPRAVKLVYLEGKPIEHEVIRSVNVFVMAYIFIFVFSLLIIVLDGKDLESSFTAVVSTINNVGPGLGIVGATGNFSSFSNLSKLVLSFDMLAGRLEIFPMLVFFNPSLWRNRWRK